MDKLILNCISFIQFLIFFSYNIRNPSPKLHNHNYNNTNNEGRVNPSVISPGHLPNLIIFIEIKLKNPITESCGIMLMVLDTKF